MSVRATARTLALSCALGLVSLVATCTPASAASIAFIKSGNVWLAAPDGTGQRQITTGGGWDAPTQADDGTILAQRGTQLVRMDRNGTPLVPAIDTSFTGAPPTWAGPVDPVISPDGVNQAYGGMLTDSGVWDPYCGCYDYTHIFTTLWGSATQYSQPNQTLGQEDYVDPAWIDNSHLMVSSTGILIAQVATYAIGGGDNSMTAWFSDPDQTVQALDRGAISRSQDKLAFVANVQGGVGNEIRIYTMNGPPPSAPTDACNIGPNSFQSLRVSFSPDGQSLVYDAPDGVHLVTLTGFPSCAGLTDQLIIPGAIEPYFGPADVGSPTPAPTPTPTPTSTPTRTPTPTPTPAPTGAGCTVPRLHGLSLAAARGSLRRAHCILARTGTARSAGHKRRRLVVVGQRPAAGGRPHDGKVSVVLGIAKRR
jgi:hypothetical protein